MSAPPGTSVVSVVTDETDPSTVTITFDSTFTHYPDNGEGIMIAGETPTGFTVGEPNQLIYAATNQILRDAAWSIEAPAGNATWTNGPLNYPQSGTITV